MPSPTEFSIDPNQNTTINGLSVAENTTSPASVNNVLRYLAATIRVAWDAIPDVATFMPRIGGAFTGDITRQGRGAYLHHASSAQASGIVHHLPEGSPQPALNEGDVVWFYS